MNKIIGISKNGAIPRTDPRFKLIQKIKIAAQDQPAAANTGLQ